MAKRANTVTVDIGAELRAVLDAVKGREIQDPYAVAPKDSDIVRDALRQWAAISPYAMDQVEMWLLRASRAAKREEKRAWAAALLGLHGHFKHLKGGMGDGLYAELHAVARGRDESSDPAPDSLAVRPARKRRA